MKKYHKAGGLTDVLGVWSQVVKDDPNTPERFQDLLEQATATLATCREDQLKSLDADFRALSDEDVAYALSSFVELYRQLRRQEMGERALEGANILVECAEREVEKRGLAA